MTDLKELKAEILLLSKIKCPNVVKYFGSYIKSKSLWVCGFSQFFSTVDLFNLRFQWNIVMLDPLWI
jgi:hypothetical protein